MRSKTFVQRFTRAIHQWNCNFHVNDKVGVTMMKARCCHRCAPRGSRRIVVVSPSSSTSAVASVFFLGCMRLDLVKGRKKFWVKLELLLISNWKLILIAFLTMLDRDTPHKSWIVTPLWNIIVVIMCCVRIAPVKPLHFTMWVTMTRCT